MIHVAAPDPLCTGRHANLITLSVVAYRCPSGVTTMEKIIARKWRIVSARIEDAIVNCVVPVVIMTDVLSVPTAVMRFESVMCPTLPRVSARYRNSLTSKAQCLHICRMRVRDARFYHRRYLRLQ